MLRIEPFAESTVIVVIGNFNPAIFNPDWLVARKLISSSEARDAKLHVIHPEFADFEIHEFRLSVQADRFQILSKTSHPEIVRDLVMSMFGELLPHTPIRAVGLNRAVHFDCQSPEARQEIGRRLAPLEPWGEFGKQLEVPQDNNLKSGGLLSLTMQLSKRLDKYSGAVQVKIEPSGLSPLKGIYIEVNDHYVLDPPKESDLPGVQMAGLIETQWEWSIQQAEAIIDNFMSLGEV